MAQNAILRRQPLTILQQIEELKNWHRQQQSKLNASTEIVSKEKDHKNLPSKQFRNENISDQLSEKSIKSTSQKYFDEQPIRVINSNFNDIIENNIAPNENLMKPTEEANKNGEKSKFAYLKRGEGIARFRMGPQKICRYSNKNNRTLSLSNDQNKTKECKQSVGNEQNLVSNQRNYEHRDQVPTLKPPDVKLEFKNWRNILSSGNEKAEKFIEQAVENNKLDLFQPNSSIDSSTASVMEHMLVIGRKMLKERQELRVFETMEQHLLDSSFCSTSSYVTELMANAVMSTPEKKPSKRNFVATCSRLIELSPEPPINIEEQNESHNNTEQERQSHPVWVNVENPPHFNSQGIQTKPLEESLHVRFAKEVDYKSFVDYSQSVDISAQKDIDGSSSTECDLNETLKENNYEDKRSCSLGIKNLNQKETSNANSIKFDESEEWKETSDEDSRSCSQCSTLYSSSDEDVRPISPPINPPSRVLNHQVGHLKHQSNKQFHNLKHPRNSVNNSNLQTNTTQDNSHETKTNKGIELFEPILGVKLKELEEEIENFRLENNKLKALREQFQQEKKKLLKEVEEEKKQIEKNAEKNAGLLEEEKKKLARDKLVFEKYSKSLAKNPTKEERKEMQELKEQLKELKEEMNKKESRWAAAQARTRNQLKHVEEDNKKLKAEVEILRKQARMLEFLTKKKGKPYNNTKLIHAINEHISNVGVTDNGDKEKSIPQGGYFKQKSNDCITASADKLDPITKINVKVIREEQKNKSIASFDGYSDLVESTQNKIISKEKPSRENRSPPLLEQGLMGREIENRNNCKEKQQEKLVQSINNDKSPEHLFAEEIAFNTVKETINKEGDIEKVYPDGRIELFYKNGNIKKIDPVTRNEKTIYYNGDVKETLRDGTVKYYFSKTRRWQTTFPDGLDVWEFPNGQVEKKHKNGTVEILFPNDVKKISYPDGSEVIYYNDGSTLQTDANNRRVLSLPNGQKEIHTDDCVWREYPDGTIKKVFPDGFSETVYSNGRVRVKDKQGNLVMDSGTVANSRL